MLRQALSHYIIDSIQIETYRKLIEKFFVQVAATMASHATVSNKFSSDAECQPQEPRIGFERR